MVKMDRRFRSLFALTVLLSLVILISCGYPTKTEDDLPENLGLSFGASSTFEVISWNLETFPKSSETADRVADLIHGLDVDITGFQEIESSVAFEQIVNRLNNLSDDHWVGYRAGSSSGTGMELAYIVNSSQVEIIQPPFEIYVNDNREFPREPYVLRVRVDGDEIVIINNHLKCCGNGEIESDEWDEETRRRDANSLLEEYIDYSWDSTKVIVLGDFNDEINESESDNVFWNFISNSNTFKFVDMSIAEGHTSGFSYPTWPSHIDHILITNELFDEFESESSFVTTIQIDDGLENGWTEYDTHISDHLPVGWRFSIETE